jgi:dTDP-4-dehydrorhamnose 3,5-epimerase
MNRLSVKETPLPGLKIVDRSRIGDGRGFLARCFCSSELLSAGWRKPVAQANVTRTQLRGTVRGLHYQRPPHAEMKLVSCLRGAVWDVALDLRKGSPTFLRWHAEELSEENERALLIPDGFAHGFQTLCEGAEMLYFHSAAHHPEAEAGFSPLDPRLGIPWPEAITLLSERDQSHPLLSATFAGVEL